VEPRYFAHWPPDMPRSLRAPRITLQEMFLRSARKFPDKPASVFQGSTLTYSELKERIESLAGYLQHECGVQRGDRVLLCMQNGHDFVIACFAILLADAVVVPVSPANLTGELRHYIEDSDAKGCAYRGRSAGAVYRLAAGVRFFTEGNSKKRKAEAKPIHTR
jgi:fatty-acyl-CoA synthase